MEQYTLAKDVSDKITYEFLDSFLVKPLPPVMVSKEFEKPVASEEAKKDENGVEAVDYSKTEKEVKEVEADFKKGIVLKVPYSYKLSMESETYPQMPIEVGDIMVYRSSKWFDLMKDSVLVKVYDIVAIERQGDAEI